MVARLKPGITEERARTEVKAIAARLAEQYPNSSARQSMTVESLHRSYVGDLRPALMLLLGAVAFVLLIACGNVANLLLARAAGRQKEIAVRRALGAPRGRLLRQLLTESVLLAGLGAVLGVVLAYWGVQGLVASLPANVPRADEIRVDGLVLAFTGALAVFTGLLFGIAPAWKISSGGVQGALREEGRGTVGPGHHRLRNTLVVAEIALALVLLVGAGLLVRSFVRVLGADAGFRAEGVLVASLPLPATRFPEEPQARGLRAPARRARPGRARSPGRERGRAPARRMAELLHAGGPAGAASRPAPVRRHRARDPGLLPRHGRARAGGPRLRRARHGGGAARRRRGRDLRPRRTTRARVRSASGCASARAAATTPKRRSGWRSWASWAT